MFLIIPYLKKVGWLNGGKALDLGCSDGSVSLILLENGYEVDAVDIKPQEIEGVNFIQRDVRNFSIKENYYDLIVCINVLPFLSNRQEVEETVARMYTGLKKGGVMYFTLFGTRDPWVKQRPKMTFIDDFTPPGKEICRAEFFGFAAGKTCDTKIWHKFDFVVKKEG